ncbi:hypothetical protein AB0J28_00580 [Streptosporangium canum]|uniref:hypothetical protein n=1 Tax=Streptosporangium canum TaxID=324952 RepID=UPI00343207AE
MTTPDDTLAAIDDVITWHGDSDDAMVWTADRPKRPDLSGLAAIVDAARPSPEAARALTERLATQMQAFNEAVRPVAEQMVHTARAVSEALALIINSPEGRALIEAAERGEIEPDPPSCHCLCQASHKGQQGICEHDAIAEIVRVSPTVGRVEIPVCGPCRGAQMAVAR